MTRRRPRETRRRPRVARRSKSAGTPNAHTQCIGRIIAASGDDARAEALLMTFPNVVFIRHKVMNFRKWKAVFEAHSAARVALGCQGAHIFRRADNPK